MSINEKKKQGFLEKLKCVACNSKNVSPEPYKYKQVEKVKILARIRKNSTLVFTLDVPICKLCKKKFFKWRFYNYTSILIFVLGILGIMIGILFLIFHLILGGRGVPLISFGFIFVIIGLIVRYIIGKIDSNPRNHFFYDFINTDFYVKPEGESNWILYKLWLNSVLGK